jgi:hypothetical protein
MSGEYIMDGGVDKVGIRNFTETEAKLAIAHRDIVLKDLYDKLTGLNASIAGLANIAPFVGSLDPSALGQMPDPMKQFPTPVRPNLSVNFPNAPVLPTVNYHFQDIAYNSILLTACEAKLIDLVNNVRSTGLDPAILQQNWDREREKSAAVAQGIIDNIGRQYSNAGWIMPVGDEMAMTFKALEAQAETDITASRTIAITNAELEQKNFQFAFTQAVALEAQTMNLFTASRQRALESAKQSVEAIIAIIKADIDVYVAEIDAQTKKLNAVVAVYEADASVYKTEIEGESVRITSGISLLKSKLDYYSTKIDVDIKAYTANIAALLSKNEMLLKAQETEAQLLAQVAASIGGAVNFSSSISGSCGYVNLPVIATIA